MQVLALDFDGVISDSAGEVMSVAARTWRALHPEEPFANRLEALALGDSVPSGCSAELLEGFRRLLPLGNRAEDFGVALWILARGDKVPDQPAYDAVKAEFDKGWTDAFHKRFYAERTALREADPTRWVALQGPFEPMLALLRRRSCDAELALATAKDRTSVRVLLEAYGISDLLPEDRVWDKESGIDKSDHLSAISESLAAPFERITFVDDKLNHLERTRHLGVRGVLAGWGFNGRRELHAARALGFEVATLSTAEAVLFPDRTARARG